MPGQQHSQPTPAKGVCLFRCNLPFWQNDRGLLHATAVTRGWNRQRIRVRTQSELWRRQFSRRFRTRNLSIMSLVFHQRAILAPDCKALGLDLRSKVFALQSKNDGNPLHPSHTKDHKKALAAWETGEEQLQLYSIFTDVFEAYLHGHTHTHTNTHTTIPTTTSQFFLYIIMDN